jgi:PHS family inorganic phosphate transporter-like MFS transporter
VTNLLGRIYYQDNPFVTNSTVNPGVLPIGTNAAISAVALVGTLCGQLLVGHIGDRFGRKRVYGIALAIMIVCAFCQSFSFGSTPQAGIQNMFYLHIFRLTHPF